MKGMLTILLLSYCTICNARQPIRRLAADSLPNTFAFRAHVLPWTFGNDGGIGYGVGGEYGFGKVHAIGLDIAYRDGHSGEEKVLDTATNKYKDAAHQRFVERGIVISYRRYLPYREGKNNAYRPYLSGFARFGNMDNHPEDGYINYDPSLRNRVKYDEQQTSVGILYGVIYPYRIGHLNIDMNMGPFWKWKTIRDVRTENGTNVTYRTSSQNFGWRIGFNVAFVCKR